ncbi:MAG: DEXDc helicase [Sylvanvirus sp.]|uniref:DEXDc helicase n=1 Tax=Sylvanvirus sp. TaxID=2487774 RepID=A0A3G5AH75_9VIRU|nr:MAG: DEXDc helicase [Sylvanvirus sp.]
MNNLKRKLDDTPRIVDKTSYKLARSLNVRTASDITCKNKSRKRKRNELNDELRDEFSELNELNSLKEVIDIDLSREGEENEYKILKRCRQRYENPSFLPAFKFNGSALFKIGTNQYDVGEVIDSNDVNDVSTIRRINRQDQAWIEHVSRSVIDLSSDSDSSSEVMDHNSNELLVHSSSSSNTSNLLESKDQANTSTLSQDQMMMWPVYNRLRPHQQTHVKALAKMARHQLVLFDTSETGTGKTYTGFGLAEQLAHTLFQEMNDQNDLRPVHVFIVTVKGVIVKFCALAADPNIRQFVRTLGVVNPELARSGKHKVFVNPNEPSADHLQTDLNPYLIVTKKNTDTILPYASDLSGSAPCHYIWNLPPRSLIILDEAHKMRNLHAESSQLITSFLEQCRGKPPSQISWRLLLSSATLLENIEQHLKTYLYYARFIQIPSRRLALQVVREPRVRRKVAMEFKLDKQAYDSKQLDVLVLHHLLYQGPYPCARGMTLAQPKLKEKNSIDYPIDDSLNHSINRPPSDSSTSSYSIPSINSLPSPPLYSLSVLHEVPTHINEIRAEAYHMSDENRQAIQTHAQQYWDLFQLESCSSWHIRLMTRLRVKTEYFKIDTFIELADHALQAGLRPVILLNFAQNVIELRRRWIEKYPLNTFMTIIGGQSIPERQHEIESFTRNERVAAFISSDAGATGIDLHDIDGHYPRVALISPPLSSTRLVQILGRCFRDGSLSSVWQILVTCQHTIEDQIYKSQKWKLQGQDLLNYGKYSSRTQNMFCLKDISELLQQIETTNQDKFGLFLTNTAPLREVRAQSNDGYQLTYMSPSTIIT